jgi:hypothetical protein
MVKLLGMLGSEHQGERAAAALQAEAFRRQRGMTWEQIIKAPIVVFTTREVVVEKSVFIDRAVPLPLARSIITSIGEVCSIKSVPGFFIWMVASVAVIDVLCRALGV